MCKLRVTQFTCGHTQQGIEEMCGWMQLRPNRATLQCPYRDPKGTLIRNTSKCRECYFADPEIPSQFRDPNIIKRAPLPETALADQCGVGSNISPWSLTKEERRQRVAERYGIYSERDLPGYGQTYEPMSQTLENANDARSSHKNDSRVGNSHDYRDSFAYEHHAVHTSNSYATSSNLNTPTHPTPAPTATEKPKSRERLTRSDAF
ncbi:hypothetical protein TWF506_002699 [Arthrobotrys conoides]|uniref:Uncharacterized protein n=1 Tax=Arthrobotrys conoides TaxID=74498 RepID=A0AAN8RT71_9PEZI